MTIIAIFHKSCATEEQKPLKLISEFNCQMIRKVSDDFLCAIVTTYNKKLAISLVCFVSNNLFDLYSSELFSKLYWFNPEWLKIECF